jgi:hypothetical protein
MVYKAIQIYSSLGKGYIDELERFYLLENFCKNGWEYFCLFLKKVCKT